jgi:hypothetical protein
MLYGERWKVRPMHLPTLIDMQLLCSATETCSSNTLREPKKIVMPTTPCKSNTPTPSCGIYLETQQIFANAFEGKRGWVT